MCTTVEGSTFKTIEALAAILGRWLFDLTSLIQSITVKVENPNGYAWVECVVCEVVV